MHTNHLSNNMATKAFMPEPSKFCEAALQVKAFMPELWSLHHRPLGPKVLASQSCGRSIISCCGHTGLMPELGSFLEGYCGHRGVIARAGVAPA